MNILKIRQVLSGKNLSESTLHGRSKTTANDLNNSRTLNF